MDIGNAFKQGLPVIMNLGGADRDLARRLIDFASGVVFAREGSMERVAPQVYLITPTDVEVSDDDRRRLQERGLHR
jgi:cell division inhibitor SepF